MTAALFHSMNGAALAPPSRSHLDTRQIFRIPVRFSTSRRSDRFRLATCVFLVGTLWLYLLAGSSLLDARSAYVEHQYRRAWKLHEAARAEGNQTVARFKVGPLPWHNGQTPMDGGFAGYLNVRKHPDGWQEPDPTSSAFPHRSATHGQANAFFWFLPAQAPTTSQPPLILWLQGGPGSSSMIGLFEELGPFALDPTTHLPFRNPHTWNDRYSLLFIDNPVGSGFSFVHPPQSPDQPPLPDAFYDESDDSQPLYVNGYAANQRAVAQDLLKVLTKFYRLFPHQRGSPLYLAGESYAGKYIPHFAKIIQEFNQNAEHPIPFRGVMTGDGLTDPLSQITYHAPLGLAQGLISRRQARKVEELSSLAIRSARGGQWMEGARWRNKLFDYVANVTGGINFYDIRLGDAPNAHVALEHYLSRPDVRRAINVCDPSSRNNPDKNRCMPYTRDPAVKVHLLHDALRPSTPQIPPLLQSNISVLLYQGQFDFRDGAMGQSQWIEDLNWHGREEYGRAKRRIWKLGGRVVGYVTKAQGLVRVEVLGAGHFVPKDQRKVGKRMIEAFIEGGFHH